MNLWRNIFGKKNEDNKSNPTQSASIKTKSVNTSIGIEEQSESKNDLIQDTSLPENFSEIPYTENFYGLLKQKVDWDDSDTASYAMWFKLEVDNDFNESFTKKLLTEIYTIQRTHYSYIIADIGNHLALSAKPLVRMELPNEFSSYPFISENNEKVILSVSKNKGIRFHFSSESPLVFRLYFLRSFLVYCKVWESNISQNTQNMELDDGVEFVLWWKYICNMHEESQDATSIGLIQN